MKPITTITVHKEALTDAISKAAKLCLCPSRRYKTFGNYIFSCIVFRMDNDHTLEVIASDYHQAISIPVGLASRQGDTCTFALMKDNILPVLRRLAPQYIKIDIYEHQAVFHHFYGEFTLPLVTEDINVLLERKSKIETPPTDHVLELEVPFLRSMFTRLCRYTALDKLRPTLHGFCIRRRGGKIDYVATDRHRLIKITKPDLECTLPSTLIISTETVQIIKRLIPRTGFLTIRYTEWKYTENKDKKDQPAPTCCISMENQFSFWFTPVEGRYPNYDAVIPVTFDHEVQIDRILLSRSLDRLYFFTPTTNIVRASLTTNKIEIHAADKDFKIQSCETLPCQYEGHKFRFGLKIDNVQQALSSLPGKEIVIHASNKVDRAIVCTPATQPENEQITTLFMSCVISD